MSRSPGANAQMLSATLDQGEQEDDAGEGDDEAGDDQRALRDRLARRSAASEETRMPTVAAVKITPVWIAL